MQGLQKAEQKTVKAVQDLQAALVSAQNGLAADSLSVSDRAGQVPVVEDAMRGAVLPVGGDVKGGVAEPMANSIASLLMAKTAYTANLKALAVTDETQDALMRLVKKA